MMLLQWDDTFHTGIVAADYEHRKMLDLINRLYGGWLRGGKSDSANLFDDLFNVLLSHFAIEDRLMSECNYDQRDLHTADHNQIVEHVREIAARADDTNYDFASALASRLQGWLASHIRTHDVRMYKAL